MIEFEFNKNEIEKKYNKKRKCDINGYTSILERSSTFPSLNLTLLADRDIVLLVSWLVFTVKIGREINLPDCESAEIPVTTRY